MYNSTNIQKPNKYLQPKSFYIVQRTKKRLIFPVTVLKMRITSSGWTAAHLTPGLICTMSVSAFHFQSKPSCHQYYFNLPAFSHFCFFSRFPTDKTTPLWLAPSPLWSFVLALVCLFTDSNASAVSLPEICLSWHYRGLVFCQSTRL